VTAPHHDALVVHARECDECRAVAPPLDDVAARLAADTPVIDAESWSRGVLARVRPELTARARAVFWRRLLRVLTAALIPLPLVLAADLWWLGRIYDVASVWLPAGLAADLVLSYAATLLALLGSAYAAIPLLLAAPVRQRTAEPVPA
jgi:hypothetical protein